MIFRWLCVHGKKTYFDDARLGKYGTSAYLFLTALNYELMLFFRFLYLFAKNLCV